MTARWPTYLRSRSHPRFGGDVRTFIIAVGDDVARQMLRWPGRYDPARRHSSVGMKFEIIGQLRSIETIATGREIRVLASLRKKWGPGRWRKMKGIARVRILRTGHIREAEIHWYEAHGIGRRDFKIKKLLT